MDSVGLVDGARDGVKPPVRSEKGRRRIEKTPCRRRALENDMERIERLEQLRLGQHSLSGDRRNRFAFDLECQPAPRLAVRRS